MQILIAALMLVGVMGSCKSSEPAKSSTTSSTTTTATEPPGDAGPIGTTSPPSAAAIAAANSFDKIEVLVFAQPGKMRDQMVGYFEDLAKKVKGGMEVRGLERVVAFSLATKHNVASDNTIVFATDRGTRRMILKDEGDLRRLDSLVEDKLAILGLPQGNVVVVSPFSSEANVRYESFSMMVGGPRGINTPSDARPRPEDILLIIDRGGTSTKPWTDLLATHMQAGGSAFVALEPMSGRGLGKAEAILGIGFDPTLVADDKPPAERTKSPADHHALVTEPVEDQSALGASFLSTRYGGRSTAVFQTSGSLRISTPSKGKSVAVRRTMPSAFLDRNGNGIRDTGESAEEQAVVAVYEHSVGRKRSRAVVYADGTWLHEGEFNRLDFLMEAMAWLESDEGLESGDAQLVPARDEDLVTYPVRAIDPVIVPQPLWNEEADGITLLVARRGITSVTVKRRKGKLRIEKRTLYTGSHRGGFGDGGGEWLEYWAAPTPKRALGKFNRDEQSPSGSLFFSGSITISWGSKTRTLEFGNTSDRRDEFYVLDPETDQLYLFDASEAMFL